MQFFVSLRSTIEAMGLHATRKRDELLLFIVVFVLACALTPLLLLAGLQMGFGLLIGGTLAVLIAVLVVRWPVFGLFTVLVCAVAIENGTLHLASDFTDKLNVFYWPPALQGLFERPIGFLFLFVLAVLIISRLTRREQPLQGGPLLAPFGLFLFFVVLGVVHGLASGGSLKIIVVELRPLWYLFVSYLLAYNLIASSRHLSAFFWIAILGAGLKGIQGLYLFSVVLQGSLKGHDEMMAHEESFFFVALLVLVVLFCLHYRYRAQLIAALLVLPGVLLSLIANQRRADYIALLLGVVVAWVLIFTVRPQARKALAAVGLAVLLLSGTYIAVFRHSQSTLASPARSVIAIFSPSKTDLRDILSNLYRVTENYDLKYTAKQNSLLGEGFGKAFLTPIPLPDISADDEYYLYIPHNTIYWLWMRLGPLGYLAFWYLFGSIIVRGCLIVRNVRYSYVQMAGIYVIAVTVMELVVSFADYQLFFYRNVIYMGLLVGLLMRLPLIEQQEARKASLTAQQAIQSLGVIHQEKEKIL